MLLMMPFLLQLPSPATWQKLWKYEGHKNQCGPIIHHVQIHVQNTSFFCFCFDMSRLWVGNSAMLQGTPTPSNYVALRSTIRQRIQGKNWWELNQAEHFEGRSKASTSESAPTSWSFKDLKSRNVRLCLACVLLQVRVYWVSGHPGIPIVCGATITNVGAARTILYCRVMIEIYYEMII